MYIFKQISRIIKDGIRSLCYDLDGRDRPKKPILLWFVIVPVAMGVLLGCMGLSLGDDTVNALLSVLSIFTALIFGVLFTVPDKLSQRIERVGNVTREDTRNYLIRFSTFTKLFVQQISFTIVLSIVLILFLILEKTCSYHFLKVVITSVISILFFDLVLYLLATLSNIYILLMDDLKTSNKKINRRK